MGKKSRKHDYNIKKNNEEKKSSEEYNQEGLELCNGLGSCDILLHYSQGWVSIPNLSAPIILWLHVPSVPLPTPWKNRNSSLEYNLFQMCWYLGCLRSYLYLRDFLVSSLIAGISQSNRNWRR